MTIKQFSTYLEKLDGISSRNEMTAVLAELFTKASADEIDKICYLSLGRLAPKFEGIEFQMSGKSMIKVLALGYQIDAETIKKQFKQAGDLGTVAYKLASSKLKAQMSKQQRKSQTVSEVYDT